MAEISVIVPVYNVENYLEACIQSIWAQDFHDFELILVEDASTDGSLELCRRLRDASGGKIHLLLDQSFYGPRFSVEIPDVKGWQEVTCNIPPEAGLQGVHAIWLAFSVPGSGTLDLYWFRFE